MKFFKIFLYFYRLSPILCTSIENFQTLLIAIDSEMQNMAKLALIVALMLFQLCKADEPKVENGKIYFEELFKLKTYDENFEIFEKN